MYRKDPITKEITLSSRQIDIVQKYVLHEKKNGLGYLRALFLGSRPLTPNGAHLCVALSREESKAILVELLHILLSARLEPGQDEREYLYGRYRKHPDCFDPPDGIRMEEIDELVHAIGAASDVYRRC